MNLKGSLVRIATIVAEEAAGNPEFHARLLEAIGGGGKSSTTRRKPATTASTSPRGPGNPHEGDKERRGGRRAPAVLDPVDLATQGEVVLRAALANLDLERLHDIVAQYGMDPGKLVMKWRDRERVIDRIVEVALARATKGDAFRKE